MFRLVPVISTALLLGTMGPALALTEKEIERALGLLYAQGYEHDRDQAESVRAAILAYERDWQLPEVGVLNEELFERLQGKHPDTMSREQWTEDGRCLFHSRLPTPHSTVSFDGECPNGLAQGDGTQTWRFMLKGEWVQTIATGSFVDGELSGKGTYRWAGGQVYEGDFVHGKRTGHGITSLPYGDVYEGDFVDGARNGYGIYRWASGNVYEGEFVNDVRSGQGLYRWVSGNSYEGDFVDGVRTGHGEFRWANGDVYAGDFVDGAQTGYGVLRLADGTVVEGMWIDGVLQE